MDEVSTLAPVEEKEYHTNVSTIEKAMMSLTTQLKPNLEMGKYTLLVGDDTSGRLPTLVLRDVIAEIQKRNGREPIPTQFLQGGREVPDEVVEKQVQEMEKRHKISFQESFGRVLLVTDTIEKGRTMERYARFFGEEGIDFDIATVGLSDEFESYITFGRTHLPHDTRVFFGQKGIPSGIFKRAHLTGLKSATAERRHVEIAKFPPEVRKDTLQAREDVKTLSRKIINHLYLNPSQKAA